MNAPTTAPTRGFNVLLEGPTGTGKTFSLRTLIEAGVTPFCIFTEPGYEVLEDIPADKCHWKYIPPASVGWDSLLESAQKINQMTYDSLSKLGGVNKQHYKQFMEVITNLHNFTCDRTGEEFGDVSTWGPDRAIVIDGLSGLSQMAMDLVVGSKPTKAMPDWMMAQDNLQRLLDKLSNDTNCHFILIAHIEPEKDEVTGGTQLMASTLGRKLAPKLPRNFSDVVLARREESKFYWSTTNARADLKARNLPLSDTIEPSFKLMHEKWSARRAAGTVQPQAEGGTAT